MFYYISWSNFFIDIFQNAILAKFSDAVRSNLTKIQRLKVNALVTIEIHARDVIESMYKKSEFLNA